MNPVMLIHAQDALIHRARTQATDAQGNLEPPYLSPYVAHVAMCGLVITSRPHDWPWLIASESGRSAPGHPYIGTDPITCLACIAETP